MSTTLTPCSSQWFVLGDLLLELGWPEAQVLWLRCQEGPTALGVVWRAEPRCRGFLRQALHYEPLVRAPAAWWSPRTRMLLVEDHEVRQRAWQAPELRDFLHTPGQETRGFGENVRRHGALGTMCIAVRKPDAFPCTHWPRWRALYSDRWGLEAYDLEMASHAAEFLGRFEEGGLQGLLTELEEVRQEWAVLQGAKP